jgi:prevent-host-death family protein
MKPEPAMPTPIELEPMNATDAKNHFGDLLDKAVRNRAVSLLKHGKPAAYVISPELYERAMAALSAAPPALQRLERDFERMLARMQAPESLAVMKGLMSVDTAALHDSLRQGTRPARKVARRA